MGDVTFKLRKYNVFHNEILIAFQYKINYTEPIFQKNQEFTIYDTISHINPLSEEHDITARLIYHEYLKKKNHK